MAKYNVQEVIKVLEHIEKECKDVYVSIIINPYHNKGITFGFENKNFNLTEINLFPEELATPPKITETKSL